MKRTLAILAFCALTGCGTNERIAMRNQRDAEACNMGYAASCIDYARETQPPIVVYDPYENEREIMNISRLRF